MAGFYTSANWLILRERQLARQPFCEGCDELAEEVDHIVPISAGGAARDPANLQSLCSPCHSLKTAFERAGYVWIKPKDTGCNPDGSPRTLQRWASGRSTSTAHSERNAPAVEDRINFEKK